MRKINSLLTAILCLTLLAGCTKAADGVTETFTAESAVSEASVTEASESEVTTEAAEIIAEESDSPVTESDIDLGIVVITQETVPENAKVYEFDRTAPAEMPEFSMSLDGLGEYDAETVLRTRTEIIAMLECSKTGEIPYISYNDGFEYALRRLENIKVESWSVVDEEYNNGRYEVTATLEISESSVDEIPVGTADYVFIYQPGEDRGYLPLRKVGELDEDRLLPYYGEGREYLKFCNDFTAYFSDLFEGDEVTDFSNPDLTAYGENPFEAIFYAMITAKQYHPEAGFDMSYETFDKALRELYGFSAESLNTKESGYYNSETDSVSVPGRGIYWVCGYLADESFDEEAKTHTVTIDYYEDDFHLVKSQTYRYTVRENENGSLTMLKMERLFTSDRRILSGCV